MLSSATIQNDFTRRLVALAQEGPITAAQVLMAQTQEQRQQLRALVIDNSWNAEQTDSRLPSFQEFATTLMECTNLTALIFEFNHLETLSLDDLTNLCQIIVTLPHLQHLEVRYNNVGHFTTDRLGVLSRTFSQCSALTIAKLHGNSLGALPETQLEELGYNLATCPYLKILDLSSNLGLSQNAGFPRLLTQLSRSPSLIELDLSSNELNQSPPSVFEALGNFTRLHSLHLRTNELGLAAIPTYRALCSNLSKLPALIRIDLTRNCLAEIETGTIRMLTSEASEKLELKTLASSLPQNCIAILDHNDLTPAQKSLFGVVPTDTTLVFSAAGSGVSDSSNTPTSQANSTPSIPGAKTR